MGISSIFKKEKSKVEPKKGKKRVKGAAEEKVAADIVVSKKADETKIPAAEAGEEKALDQSVKTIKNGAAYKILVKPLVTEKATHLSASNKYVFEVAIGANKIEISKAIFDVYGKKPVAVNIIKMKGKEMRYGKTMGQRKNKKKAVVGLKPGETITIYEGV